MHVCVCVYIPLCSLSTSGHWASQKRYLVSVLTGGFGFDVAGTRWRGWSLCFRLRGHNPDTGVRWGRDGGLREGRAMNCGIGGLEMCGDSIDMQFGVVGHW